MSTYTVRLNDTPSAIAARFTGDPSRMRELITVNSHKPTHLVNGVRTFKALTQGESLNLPTSWKTALGLAKETVKRLSPQNAVPNPEPVPNPQPGVGPGDCQLGSAYPANCFGNSKVGGPQRVM